jgi:hypothetical protein
LLRTLKCLSSEAGDPEGFRLDVTRAWCRALPEKIERLGASTLAAAVAGDALTTPLAALKKLTRVTPVNTVAMKRRVAAIMIDAERYPL